LSILGTAWQVLTRTPHVWPYRRPSPSQPDRLHRAAPTLVRGAHVLLDQPLPAHRRIAGRAALALDDEQLAGLVLRPAPSEGSAASILAKPASTTSSLMCSKTETARSFSPRNHQVEPDQWPSLRQVASERLHPGLQCTGRHLPAGGVHGVQARVVVDLLHAAPKVGPTDPSAQAVSVR
jgi:hypothetical protein